MTVTDTMSDDTMTDDTVIDRPGRRTRRRMPRRLRIALGVVIVICLVETMAFAGTYLLYSRHYVSTDNAQIDGDVVSVNAPASGTLRGWTITEGDTLRHNEVVGRVELTGSGPQPLKVIKSPGGGTIASVDAADGQWVSQGSQLAAAYDLSKIYLTARVKDTDIGGVRLGAPVEFTVDAFHGTRMYGTVEEIQNSAAGEFTIYPASDEDPTNPQKVDQYIPVRIALTRTGQADLVPGMSATVHIDKD